MSDCQRDQTRLFPPFRLAAADQAWLAAWSDRWQGRLAGFRARGGAPWWTPGLVITPELRGRYETWLPIGEFRADLARLGERLLPHPSWVPRVLRPSLGDTCAGWPGADAPASLPDFWARLPERFAGQVTFAVADLPALFGALADPPHFGTDTERYPEQQPLLVQALAARRRQAAVRLVDLACGVGLGTYEMASVAARHTTALAPVLGLTIEPLEAWMATARRLPHDPARERRLRQLADSAPAVTFVAADARRMPVAGPVDVLVCNGLVGGTHLHRDDDAGALLRDCCRLLRQDGVLLLANRFHDGCRPQVERFAEMALTLGWDISGDWRSLCLTHPA